MNIEEDIKDLKKYISFASKSSNFSHDTDWKWHKDVANKIQNLLTAYEKEKESKQRITNKNKRNIKELVNLRYEIENRIHIAKVKNEYIHKDKIIAKVIEIKDRPVKDEFITATQGKLNTIIDIESLLDEEE